MSKEKIAIIGSGISGLSASLFLCNNYEVHLFEKNSILGGHTRTVNFKNNAKKSMSIDTGFIVFNNKNYQDLVSFFKYLNIKTENSKMSFSVSCNKPFLEYSGKNFNTLFAQRKNFFSFKFLSLLFEIKKFYKIVSKSIIVIAIIFFVYENSSRFLEYKNRYGNNWPPIGNKEILYK